MNQELQPIAGSVLLWDRVSSNKRMTWFLMILFVAVLTGLVALITIALGLPIGVIGVAGIALIIYAVVSYYVSSSVVLSISGAHEVTKEELSRNQSLANTSPSAAAKARTKTDRSIAASRSLGDDPAVLALISKGW